jgi:hypothetical protein
MREQNLISRREIFRLAAALPVLRVPRLRAQTRPRLQERAERAVQFHLVKQISGALYLAVSPDSQNLSVCRVTKPVGKITLGFRFGQRIATRPPEPPITIAVIEMNSWKELSANQFRGAPGDFSFFPGSNNLFGSYFALGPVVIHYVMIDRQTGEAEVRQCDLKDYEALGDQMLVGIEGQRVLVKAHWPNLNETLRVDTGGRAGIFRFTRDRQSLVHLVDQRLVCRRAVDFSVLWERQVDPEIDLRERMHVGGDPDKAPFVSSADYAISADGSTAALAPSRPDIHEGKPGQFYLEILDGRNGKPLRRWPIEFKHGIALSHDGKLLAVGEAARSESGGFESRARIYEVESGKEVATVVHEKVGNLFNAGIVRGIHFTPDGRYFITSGNNNVKIWAIERA